MADALCGPSNALQNFQKHTSVDRSLQQDRLASRAGPSSHGFRSNVGSSAGILDPEFVAFQEGRVPTLAEARGQILPEAHHDFQSPQRATGPPGWASDFQRLHISQPAVHSEPPAISSPALMLQRQQNITQPAAQPHQLMQSMPRFQNSQPSYNFSPAFGMQQPYAYSPMTQNLQSGNLVSEGPQQDDHFDAAAFEQEFEAHAARLLQGEAESQAESTSRSVELGHDVLLDGPEVLASLDENATWTNLAGPPRYQLDGVGNLTRDLIYPNDQIVVEEPKEKEQAPTDRAATDEDLARTAGELLQRVRDDTSTKFRESSFLQLMAQLRDGEMRVEGNDFVATNDASIATVADPAPALESDSEARYARNLSTFEAAASPQRQRPSSVPPRRNQILPGRPDPTGIAQVAGQPADVYDPNKRSPSIGRDSSGDDRFAAYLNEHGVPSTHMVDDF